MPSTRNMNYRNKFKGADDIPNVGDTLPFKIKCQLKFYDWSIFQAARGNPRTGNSIDVLIANWPLLFRRNCSGFSCRELVPNLLSDARPGDSGPRTYSNVRKECMKIPLDGHSAW